MSRKETAAPVEVAHRSITIGHLGNIAMKLNQDLAWDPGNEKFKGNPQADSMLSRRMREPWEEVYKEFSLNELANGSLSSKGPIQGHYLAIERP